MTGAQAAAGHPAGYTGHGQAAAAAEPPSPPHEYRQARPVVVEHAAAEPVRNVGADYGGWFTYQLAATGAAVQIAPHDEQRSRLLIVVQVTGGTIWIGSKAQAQASPPLGGNLPPGTFEMKHKQDQWIAPDGTHAATVSVLIERYDGTR